MSKSHEGRYTHQTIASASLGWHGPRGQYNRVYPWLRVSGWAVFIILLAGWLPSLWLSIHTPFRLIDDYSEWKLLADFNIATFAADLERFIRWRLFGAEASLHHVARIVIKFLTLIFIYLYLFRRVSHDRLQRTYFSKESLYALGLFCACFSFLFYFPNCPDAELGPTELLAGFFLMLCLVLTKNIYQHFWLFYTALLISFCFFLGTQEPNMMLAPVFIWYFFLRFKESGDYAFRLTMPFVLILLYEILKIYLVNIETSDNGAGFSLHSILTNAGILFQFLTLQHTGQLVPLMIALPIVVWFACLIYDFINAPNQYVVLLKYRENLFIFGFFLASCILFLMGWQKSLRYAYPAIICLILLWASAVKVIILRYWMARRENIIQYGLLAFALFFAAANYHNMLYQYEIQWVRGQADQVLLRYLTNLENDGYIISLERTTEGEKHIHEFLTEFRPHFQLGQAAHVIEAPIQESDADIHVSRAYIESPGWTLVQEFHDPPRPAVSRFTAVISMLAQLNHDLHVWMDPGTFSPGYESWYLYKRALQATTDNMSLL